MKVRATRKMEMAFEKAAKRMALKVIRLKRVVATQD
jgi:hypothetical protein